MLRCCASVCGGRARGGGGDGRTCSVTATESSRGVKKPVVRVNEAYAPAGSTLENLACFGLEAAPPGVDPPHGVVSANFRKNSNRVLVVLPSPGAPLGAWDTSLPGDRGFVVPLQRWAAANEYEIAVLNSEPWEHRPEAAWDGLLKGSPSRFVAVLAGKGSLPFLRSALRSVHPLLWSRVRAVIASTGDNETQLPLVQTSDDDPEELKRLFDETLMQMPPEWLNHEPFVMHQCIFQMFEDRVDRWQRSEMKKYVGFQGLKENDMPGLKRMNLNERIQRLDRDRADDELARLLKKHEKTTNVDEDEPGID